MLSPHTLASLCSPPSETDVFIYVGECRSTTLFIISIPRVAWKNELSQPNNSTIPRRYWTQLQHKIIHSRQGRGEIQLGFHLLCETETLPLPCQGTLHSYDLAAIIATPCQINQCRVLCKNDINHTLVPDMWMLYRKCTALQIIRCPDTENITKAVLPQWSLCSLTSRHVRWMHKRHLGTQNPSDYLQGALSRLVPSAHL